MRSRAQTYACMDVQKGPENFPRVCILEQDLEHLKSLPVLEKPQAGKGGVLEPPSDSITVLHYGTNLCSLRLSIRSPSVHHCAMFFPFKYSSVMLSCTVLQTGCKRVMDRELSLPQQNFSPCSLVSKAFCAWCCHLHSGLD